VLVGLCFLMATVAFAIGSALIHSHADRLGRLPAARRKEERHGFQGPSKCIGSSNAHDKWRQVGRLLRKLADR
jgi:hypothetical protein